MALSSAHAARRSVEQHVFSIFQSLRIKNKAITRLVNVTKDIENLLLIQLFVNICLFLYIQGEFSRLRTETGTVAVSPLVFTFLIIGFGSERRNVFLQS